MKVVKVVVDNLALSFPGSILPQGGPCTPVRYKLEAQKSLDLFRGESVNVYWLQNKHFSSFP